jgi:endonuclease III
MVGVHKALKALVARRVPVDREEVLRILESELEIYASHGFFRNKEQALRAICAALREDSIAVEDLLQGAGLGTAADKASKGGFFCRLLKRTRRS